MISRPRRPPAVATALALLAALAACVANPAPPRPVLFDQCSTAARPLVEVRSVAPSILTDVRYATPDNFTGAPLPGYVEPRALLRPEAAAALGRVQRRLLDQGLGLKVWDAYRPVRATLAMVEWSERTGNEWVLDQGYVARRSGHNRGATVDLTLLRLDTGEELPMGTPYDHFSEESHTMNATGEILENRLRLLRAMEAEGFENYSKEWWHYSLPGEHGELDVPIRCAP